MKKMKKRLKVKSFGISSNPSLSQFLKEGEFVGGDVD